MTLTIALDTATDLATIGVGDADGLIAEVTLGRQRHAAATVPAVLQVLDLAGATFRDVSRIVLADGPGSFTGLRIGVATVQGLLRERDGIAVFTAPSLLAAAWGGSQLADGPVAALYDALRGDVYGAVYAFEDGVRVLLPPTLAPVAELADRVPHVSLAVGDGAARYAAAVQRWTGRRPVGPPMGSPRAGALLALAARPGAVVPVPDIMTFEPTYGRPAEAQARWERQHGRPLPDSPGRPL